ncbi:hypothetical protein Tco_0692335 [Tanacetum coccineum]
MITALILLKKLKDRKFAHGSIIQKLMSNGISKLEPQPLCYQGFLPSILKRNSESQESLEQDLALEKLGSHLGIVEVVKLRARMVTLLAFVKKNSRAFSAVVKFLMAPVILTGIHESPSRKVLDLVINGALGLKLAHFLRESSILINGRPYIEVFSIKQVLGKEILYLLSFFNLGSGKGLHNAFEEALGNGFDYGVNI